MRKLLLLAICLFSSITGIAQIPGQNVNMVTGKKFPGGDPWLQKQNEPSGAISTVNPCRLLAGANDYRAVNVPGVPGDKENGDAWVGWYTSIDCGQTWYSTLVPGYPQDTTAIGKASPVYGLTTAADPTVRAGAGGFFAYSFIAFNRGSNVGKVAVARFLDRNTTEAVTKPEKAITYIDTTTWDTGAAGQYIDKPILWVTQGTGTCTVGGKVIPASVVHMAWTVFVGNSDQIIRTKVYYARSSNCGASLDGPATKLSEGYAVTQGASIAVAPNGAIYVVWRQFATTKGDVNQILVAKSVDGGKSFTKGTPVPIPSFMPFDQGTTSKTFRTNAYPATATDQWGRLYVALAVRGFAQDATQSRIVIMSTMDGAIWTMPQAVENGDMAKPGHQIMPALASFAGTLNVVWLDFRDDVSGHFDPSVKEIYPIRHTMDVRGAQAKLQQNGTLSWTSYGILQDERPAPTVPRISRYLTGDYTNETNPLLPPKQLQWNRPNLKLYAGGTRPFIGDFIDVAGLAFLTQQQANQLAAQTTTTSGQTTWVPNDGSNAALLTTAAQTFYAFWTDNRDAKVGDAQPEPDTGNDADEGAMVNYVAPGTAACTAAGPNPPTKTRNANVYSARITPGVFVAAPTNSKPSVNTHGRIQRAFPVAIQNRTNQKRTFTVVIANQPPDAPTTGIASFVQVASPIPPPGALPPPVTSIKVEIPANSGTARTVYVVSSVKFPQIRVNVIEDAAQPLTGSTILNLDGQNADIENADIENADIENADIENNEIHNADIENADIENADIENADIENADIENADIENADIENADIENADIENADIENADIENADIENADIENGAVSDYSVDLKNDGNTATVYQVKFAINGDKSPYLFQLIGRNVYKTPTAVGCELKEAGTNQILFNVNLSPNDLNPGDPPDPLTQSPTNTTVLVGPGQHIKLTLRAWDKDVLSGPNAPPNDGIQPFCPLLSPRCPVVTNQVIVTVKSVSSNTGANTPPSETFPSVPNDTPFNFIVTNTNDSGPGSLRQAIVNSTIHPGVDTISFNIPGPGVHTITPATGLPFPHEAVIIDATTQPGYAGSPLIELNGANAGVGEAGLMVIGGSTVRGLAINRFSGNGLTVVGDGNVIQANYIGTDPTGTIDLGNLGNGIRLEGTNNLIGGLQPITKNVISGNQGEGIRINGVLSTGNTIQGNFIGTNASGNAALGNSASGVYIRRSGNNSVIGNLISGNLGFAGIAICANAAFCGGGQDTGSPDDGSGNIIQGNLIGTDAAGTGALGNGLHGVSIDGAPNTTVGGRFAADRNVISATVAGPGIEIFHPGANNNLIRGNLIGTDMSGVAPLANHGDGVLIDSSANANIIGANEDDRTGPNTIKFNTGMGINVQSGQHEFRINRIDANGGLGINGGEVLNNGPTLTRVTVSNGVAIVDGSFFGAPGSPYTIDLYVSDTCDPSGYGEGAQWFGAIGVSGAIEGPSLFTSGGFGGGVVAPGQVVTALITTGDQIGDPGILGETSQFSNCQMAVPPGFKFSAPSDGGNGHVYEYVETPGTWTNARAAAAARTFGGRNGHLVTITSAFENALVGSFRGANQDLRGWIGLTDEAAEGTFQWITGEPLTYTNWNPGEPSNGSPPGTGNEDYVEIFAATVWNDNDNDALNAAGQRINQGYIVEYEVNPFAPVDLIVQSFTHSPASPTTADTITFTAVVKNNGAATAPPSTLLFTIGGETPVIVPGTLVSVPALAPGETFQVQRQAVLTAQGYINTAIADYFGVVLETNETNDTRTDSYIVAQAGGGGQLVRWNLRNVTFDDGATANGYFVVRATDQVGNFTIADWSISVTGGSNTNLGPTTFTPTSGGAHGGLQYLDVEFFLGPVFGNGVRVLTLDPALESSALLNPAATIQVLPASVPCNTLFTNCAPPGTFLICCQAFSFDTVLGATGNFTRGIVAGGEIYSGSGGGGTPGLLVEVLPASSLGLALKPQSDGNFQ